MYVDIRTPVIWAVCNNDLVALQAAIDSGQQATISFQGDSLLHLAARNCNNPRIPRLLLEHGCSLSDKNGDGLTCLELAKRSSNNIMMYAFEKLSRENEGSSTGEQSNRDSPAR